MAELTTLIRVRGGFKHSLTTFTKFVNTLQERDEITDAELAELQERVNKIEGTFQDFCKTQTDIETKCKDDELDKQYTERETFESSYFKTLGQAKAIINSHVRDEVLNTSNSVGSVVGSDHSERSVKNSSVRLPTIQLPKFAGSYENWIEFRDTFISLIDANKDLSNIQKLHYLRSSLQGQASQIIRALEVSDINYSVAWGLLCERYDNKKFLINNHVKALFNLPSVKTESAFELRKLLDELSKHLLALSALQQPVDQWSTLLIHIVTVKLDTETRREWELSKRDQDKESDKDDSDNLPSIDDLKNFLRGRCEVLENIESQISKNKGHTFRRLGSDNNSTVTLVTTGNKIRCVFCNNLDHLVYTCEKFLNLNSTDRTKEIKQKRVCLNCLKQNHFSSECKASSCKKCGKRHHTLLHFNENTTVNDSNQITSNEVNTTVAHCNNTNNQRILLSTAVIKIKTKNNGYVFARALLDSGSESCFISNELCQKLNLNKSEINLDVVSINQIRSKITHKTQINIQSCYSSYNVTLNCFIVDKITENINHNSFNISDYSIPQYVKNKLADFNSKIDNSKIDILIGANIFWNLLCPEKINLGKGHPVIQKTLLGWVVAGPFNTYGSNTTLVTRSHHLTTTLDVENQLKSFWEIEECRNIKKPLTEEENFCEVNFQNTTTRDSDGRFIVTLPFKTSPSNLGDSYEIALKRFYGLEKRLDRSPELKAEYIRFMQEYIELGHMTRVTYKNENSYYIPHHGIQKQTSITTKLRVVFDASCKTSTNISLNDIQCVGPVIQDDLINILLRFRLFKFVLSADVEKMYRQVMIQPEYRDYQRIIWREDKSKPLEYYSLNTVTYGTSAAPFLAIRALHQTAYDNHECMPKASQVILNDFYVDDLLTTSNSVEEAIQLYRDVTHILNTGAFKLRKWVSNSKEILNEISSSDSESYKFVLGDTEITRILGLIWNPSLDYLTYEVKYDCHKSVTKREMLSGLFRLYDPLGLVGPCVVVAKIMLQNLWQHKLGWDDLIPEDITQNWLRFTKELLILNNLKIPRFVTDKEYERLEIHAFSDASQVAYGTCVYIRTIQKDGTINVNLLCSKSRVAPIKPITIPKLELCGALLSVKLLQKIITGVNIKFDKIFYWCDSTIVLSWIKLQPHTLKTFVAHRITEIQNHSDAMDWHYVNTSDNPADVISRGLWPSKIINCNLWWEGPKWLSSSVSAWPQNERIFSHDIPEVKPLSKSVLVVKNMNNSFPFYSTSSLTRLIRLVAWCFRFVNNAKLKKTERLYNSLTVNELNYALKTLVRMSQQESFPEVFAALQANTNTKHTTNIAALSPFIDPEGIIRVGGRIQNSNFDYDKRHPMLLSGKHILSKLIMTNEHVKRLHAGPQLMLSFVREQFWITGGRNLAKSVYHKCVKCFKVKPQAAVQLMGNLPAQRLSAIYPFYTTGVDYAGPFFVLPKRGRGNKSFKCYISLFVCLSTKAVHLEPVTDLTTESFLATFRRFVARRGTPSHVYSDNGTNFIGSVSKLRELGNFLIKNKKIIIDSTSDDGIQWHFIPASSPHFGGLWEAGVKSVKYHLRRVLGNTSVTLEDFFTVITQIESVLNSRPLHPISSSPDDLEPLTPSHFLLGRRSSSLPDKDLIDVPMNRLSRYQYLQQIVQHFWQRWSREYISELQQRTKWTKKRPNVQIGELVIIKDDHLPPLKWRMGRICEVHPGSDNIVRVVSVKTAGGTLKRSVAKICPLPID